MVSSASLLTKISLVRFQVPEPNVECSVATLQTNRIMWSPMWG